jgi:hypothetical protein
VNKEISSSNLADIYAPTSEEMTAIGRSTFVLKKKPANVVTTSYHKWERVWDDNLTLRVIGESTDNLYRAMSFSVPLHLGGPGDDRAETLYSGFVLAIAKRGNDTRIIPMNKVSWANSPLAESTGGVFENDTDKRACDASTTNGCNGP